MEKEISKEAKAWWSLIVIGMGTLGYYSNIIDCGCMDQRRVLGYAGFTSLVMVALYVVGKYYCFCWSLISPDSKWLVLYERLLLPILVVVCPLSALRNNFIPVEIEVGIDFITVLIFSGLMVFLCDPGYRFRSYLRASNKSELGIPKGAYNRFVFAKFPPSRRSDLFPFDVIVDGVWLFMLVIL